LATNQRILPQGSQATFDAPRVQSTRAKYIKAGDRVAIKVGFVVDKKISTTGIKAIGTVLENKGDGRSLKVNWTYTGPRFDIEGASYRQTVHEVTNTEDIKLIFKGTFKSVRKSITVSEETAQNNGSNDMDNKTNLHLNLILYGPPGVGKTHQILKLREKFTSSNNANEPQKIIKWVAEQSWWTVIAATLIDYNRTVSVSEIVDHRFFKAKLLLSPNKFPNNTVWANLQSHTIKESITVNVEKRIDPLVFDKSEDSKWSLAGNWQEQLSDIIEDLKQLKTNTQDSVKRYEVVTFHQAYGYEDFIEGIRPVTSEESDTVSYAIESGVFKRISERAKADPSNDYALFIDEINRGNITKIFGELITLIEEDKRDGASNATSTILPYSKTVPSNLYVIGTMNSVDRSIALLDMALRRRFKFQRIEPDSSLVVEKVDGINFRSIFEKINERISVLLGEDYQLGHSYFLKDKIRTSEDLKSVWFENILPLFQEYFFDDWDKLRALADPFIESTEVKGLGNLGLLNSSRHRFCSKNIAVGEFTNRLKKLAETLDIE
jgi:5-methylcytosine-specific restriction protein B